MSAPNTPPAGGSSSSSNLATVLVPVAGVALIVILVIVVGATSDTTKPTSVDKTPTAPSMDKLTDGTDPNEPDAGLKDIGEGLKIRDLKEGSGPECPPGAKVTVHYTGWLKNGKVFDSSRKRGETIEFGLDGVIAGWTRGIPGMKVGGVRKLVIPPDLGYGARGAGKDIPPNAQLVFEVELVAIK